MAEKAIAFSYDPNADVLYCFYGQPREAISEETGQGVILRRDPSTDEIIVGFTVIDFSKWFREHPGAVLSP